MAILGRLDNYLFRRRGWALLRVYYTTSALVVKKEEYVTKGACNISPYVGNGIIKTWFREEIRCESYLSEDSLRVLLEKAVIFSGVNFLLERMAMPTKL